ncbi:APH(3') family aminoglycoside O-phosphotransferase [Brevundimonas sp. Marseille-Q4549]
MISGPGEDRERASTPVPTPNDLSALVAGRTWRRNLVGEAGAAVHRLSLDGAADLYLKHGTGDVAGDIVDEAARLRWLSSHVTTPQLVYSAADGEEAWLLTTALPGRTAYERMAAEPPRAPQFAALIGGFLKTLHALPAAQCPFDSGADRRLELAKARMKAGLVDVDDFDDVHAGWSAEQVWDKMIALRPTVADPVVTHGDYSLDNILIAEVQVSGCIDLGRLGVADRYQDLAIAWNYLDEFSPDAQRAFLDAYGLTKLDQDRLAFHLALDEFF